MEEQLKPGNSQNNNQNNNQNNSKDNVKTDESIQDEIEYFESMLAGDATPKYENLVFEGGGVLGIAYCGAIQVMEELNILKNIKRYAGTSAGSIFAAMMACGATADYVTKTAYNIDFKKFEDDSWGIFRDIWRFIKEYGLYPGDAFYNYLGIVIKDLTGSPNTTFKQVRNKFGNDLVLTGCNVDTQKLVYFSADSDPDMPIRLAVRISSSFPFFFKSIVYKNDHYVDGGMLNNMPIEVFDKPIDKGGKCCKEMNMKTLGLYLETTDEINRVVPRTNGFKSFCESLIGMTWSAAQNSYIRSDDYNRMIIIDVFKYKSMDMDITKSDKDILFASGVKSAKTYFSFQK
jgi:NTE family protein